MNFDIEIAVSLTKYSTTKNAQVAFYRLYFDQTLAPFSASEIK